MIFRIIIFLLLLTNHAAAKDLAESMNEFFEDAGFTSNVTSAQKVKNQSAGLYTGGSIYARNRIVNTPIANVQMPTIGAGCGGIDFFAGGFSFINEDQFVALMKGIASNSLGFAFQLGLNAISPALSETIENLKKTVNDINRLNLNSCELAQTAVGSLSQLHSASRRGFCKSIGNSRGHFRDYASSWNKCNTSDKVNSMNRNSTEDDKNAGAGNKNITWDILTSHGAGDNEYNEMVMSFVGTFITEDSQIKYLPPLLMDDKQIDSLLSTNAEKITLYKCDEHSECLSPSRTNNVTLSTNFRKKVKDMIDGIIQIAHNERSGSDTKLTAQQKAFIENAPIPIYKIINVHLSYNKASALIDLEGLEDYLAIMLMFDYLDRILTEVNIKLRQNMSLTKAERENFEKDFRNLREDLQQRLAKVNNKLKNLNNIVNRIEKLEKYVRSDLSRTLMKKRGY